MFKKVLLDSIIHFEDSWNDLCYVGKEKNPSSCKLLKDQKYDTWLMDLKKMLSIGGTSSYVK